ncbi:MAG: hypothetical protein CSB24_01780 [Deltaproteobacteria bacterium]|nr:MAG: hypothetical protein CSB24_01780 [Deltaproteobacteria bacterium]
MKIIQCYLEASKRIQDAVVRNLEIIGEAAKNISKEFKGLHVGIPWNGVAGMRDKLIHNYFGVKIDIVWDFVDENIDELKALCPISHRKTGGENEPEEFYQSMSKRCGMPDSVCTCRAAGR